MVVQLNDSVDTDRRRPPSAKKNSMLLSANIEFRNRFLGSFRRWIGLESGFLDFIMERWTIVNQHINYKDHCIYNMSRKASGCNNWEGFCNMGYQLF